MSDPLLRLRLADRRVLVAGAGSRVLGLVSRLLATRADIEVVARSVPTTIQDLAERGTIAWTARDLGADDLTDAWLLVPASDELDKDAAALALADAAHVLSLVPGAAHPAEDPVAPGHLATPVARPGHVVLVGGGPGDPGLLTLSGRAAVLGADVVVVDRLAPLAVLDELAAGVEVIDVAKIPRGRFTSQEEINAVLVRKARAGRAVVRLKGGDPFVFGRGMEEVLACEEAGVPVTVVPGVTSAIAAPALAGVPVTHRGAVQGFAVVSGHVAPEDPRSSLDWAALAAAGVSLVVLMGVATLPAIARALLVGGRGADTAVACVMDATLPTQRVIPTTLGDLAAGTPEELRAPAVTVIGEVAALASARGGARS